MKKAKEILKKIFTWICTYITNSIKIATILTAFFIILNFNALSKFSLALICAVLGILIYNIVNK